MSEENHTLRKLLWLRHGCPLSYLYGDGEEMQCPKCLIDFKKMPAIEIEQRLFNMDILRKQHSKLQKASTRARELMFSKILFPRYKTSLIQHMIDWIRRKK